MSIHVALSAGGSDLLRLPVPLPEKGSEGAIRQSIVYAGVYARDSQYFWGVVYMAQFVALSFLNFPYYLADALLRGRYIACSDLSEGIAHFQQQGMDSFKALACCALGICLLFWHLFGGTIAISTLDDGGFPLSCSRGSLSSEGSADDAPYNSDASPLLRGVLNDHCFSRSGSSSLENTLNKEARRLVEEAQRRQASSPQQLEQDGQESVEDSTEGTGEDWRGTLVSMSPDTLKRFTARVCLFHYEGADLLDDTRLPKHLQREVGEMMGREAPIALEERVLQCEKLMEETEKWISSYANIQGGWEALLVFCNSVPEFQLCGEFRERFDKILQDKDLLEVNMDGISGECWERIAVVLETRAEGYACMRRCGLVVESGVKDTWDARSHASQQLTLCAKKSILMLEKLKHIAEAFAEVQRILKVRRDSQEGGLDKILSCIRGCSNVLVGLQQCAS